MKHHIRLGLSIDNFASEFVTRKMTLEDILKQTKEMGYQGIEIAPSQMAPTYPDISDHWIERLKELLAKYYLDPICWNAFLDIGAMTGRDLSENAILKAIIQNMIYAKKAGFQLVKTEYPITTVILRKIIHLCRDLDIYYAIDITKQEPFDPSLYQEYFKIIRGEGKGYVGIITDLSFLSDTSFDRKELIDLSFCIYGQADLSSTQEEVLKSIAKTEYQNTVICRNKRHHDTKEIFALDQFERFIKQCNCIFES